MHTPLNVGMIGFSPFAVKEHLPAIRAAGGDVVACCSLDAAQLDNARKQGIARTYSDYRELIGDAQVDIVTVITPGATHSAMAEAALLGGKHVYLEKPPTQNAAQMQVVVQAAEQSGRFILAGSHHLYRDNVQYLRRCIERGELGDIYHVDAFKLRRGSAPSDPGNQSHRGGIGLGSTTHRLDMLLYLLGLPTPRAVTATTYDYFVRANNHKKGLGAASGLIEDSLMATIHFENGCSALVRDMLDAHMDPGSAEYGWFGEFTLFGSKAGAKLHPLCIYHSTQGGGLHAEQPLVNNDLHAGHTPIYRYFFDCIAKGIKPEKSPERALMVMRIMDAIYASADTGGKQVIL